MNFHFMFHDEVTVKIFSLFTLRLWSLFGPMNSFKWPLCGTNRPDIKDLLCLLLCVDNNQCSMRLSGGEAAPKLLVQ